VSNPGLAWPSDAKLSMATQDNHTGDNMAHIHAQYDFVNAAFMVHPKTGRVLLVRHKKLGGLFAPGGHIELDEDPDQALFREIEEETGMANTPERKDYRVLKPGDYVCSGKGSRWVGKDWGSREEGWDFDRSENHNFKDLLTPWRMEVHDFLPLPGHRHIAFVYLVECHTDKIRLEADAHDSIKWFTRDDLDIYQMLPSIRRHSIDALEVFGYE
jgi:8-oxo-dGTP pyrophosphatase MutT (NUDIX family)